MSAELLGLAFKAEMGSHVAKLVLLKLVDAGEDDGTKIYPAIATIARAAQAHERTVQKLLRTFQEVGLLHLVRKGGGGPGDTTEYRLDLGVLRRIKDVGWAAATTQADGAASAPEGWPEATHGIEEPKGGIDEAKGGVSGHPTPPIDPSLDPSGERDARARDPENSDKASDDIPDRPLLDRLIALHPQSAHDRFVDIATPWRKLTREQRRRAVDRFPAWLAARGKRQAIAGLPTYLGDLMFERVPAGPTPGESQFVPAFSRAWWWLYHREVTLGGAALRDRNSAESWNLRKRVNLAVDVAIGWQIVIPEKRQEAEEAGKALVALAKDSPAMAAWAEHYRGLGVTLPIPDRAEWIFMPAEWPGDSADDMARQADEAMAG